MAKVHAHTCKVCGFPESFQDFGDHEKVQSHAYEPVEVEECPTCDGYGKIDKHFDGNYMDEQVPCWNCGGSGLKDDCKQPDWKRPHIN